MALFKLSLGAALLICFVGCDPVRTVSQTVQLQILDAESHSPVSDVVISLKENFEPKAVADEDHSEDWERHQREFWEQLPWHAATSDSNGIATVEIAHTAIDRSRGKEPPPERDIVSGQTYLVKIGDATMKDRLEINKDSRTVLNEVELLVLKVGKAVYRPTE